MQRIPNITEILINTFNTLINQFIDFVPRLMGCFVILVVGYLVAKGVAVLVKNVLGRVGFDRIGEKLNEISIVKQLKTEIKLSEIIAKVLYYFILLVFLTAATETLGVDAITSMVLSIVNFIPQLIAAAIMLQVGIMLADVIKNTVTAVSYTHLDVYKRQVGEMARRLAGPAGPALDQRAVGRDLRASDRGALQPRLLVQPAPPPAGYVPVSYTHLDVYKRQMIN